MKKCSSCGFSTGDESVDFCPECGTRMTVSEDAGEIPPSIPKNEKPISKRPRSKLKTAAICSVSLSVLIMGTAVGIAAVKGNRSTENAMVVPPSDTQIETSVFTAGDIPEFQTAAETSATTAASTTAAHETESTRETAAAIQSDDLDFLAYISSDKGYSFYDVFTDVEAVFDVINAENDYSDPITYEDCYNCEFHFDTVSNNGQGYLYVYWVGHSSGWIPLSKLLPYLKFDVWSSMRIKDKYDFIGGNTPGNYANNSHLTEGLTSGLREHKPLENEIIYCGSNIIGMEPSVDSAVADGSDPRVVINESAMEVIYYGGQIYFVSYYDGCLYRSENDGTGIVRLSDSMCYEIRIYDNRIYYLEDYSRFCSMDMEGGDKEVLIDSVVYYPNFYDGFLYCISSDKDCILKYDLNSNTLCDNIYIADDTYTIDTFFIKDNILVARCIGEINSPVLICDLDDLYDGIYYNYDTGGINAYDNYIYFSCEENGKTYIIKVPLHDFTNESAVWKYEMPGLFNGRFYIAMYTEENIYDKYIFQFDNNGDLRRYDLP